MALTDTEARQLNEMFRILRESIPGRYFPEVNVGDLLRSASIDVGDFNGDAADGDVDLDGVTSYPFATLDGSTYTLTRTVFAENLTIRPGVTLNTASFYVFATDTIRHDGSIVNDGNAASASSGGAVIANGAACFGFYAAGVNGTTGAGTAQAGTNGGTNLMAGAGGGGGLENGTTAATGTYAGPTPHTQSVVRRGTLFWGSATAQIVGTGAGGAAGRGSGDGTNAGGGSGAVGGNILIQCKRFVMGPSALIRANGGAGGQPAAGNTGGGGGGGGGVIFVYAREFDGAEIVKSPATPGGATVPGANIKAEGGAGGAGRGTGGPGGTGTTGAVFVQVLN